MTHSSQGRGQMTKPWCSLCCLPLRSIQSTDLAVPSRQQKTGRLVRSRLRDQRLEQEAAASTFSENLVQNQPSTSSVGSISSNSTIHCGVSCSMLNPSTISSASWTLWQDTLQQSAPLQTEQIGKCFASSQVRRSFPCLLPYTSCFNGTDLQAQ